MIKSNKILGVMSISLAICCIISVIAFFLYPFVSQDSGYYLSMMRDMHQGHIYFKDIATPYNPLAIAVLSLPYYFTTTTLFSYHLAINLVILGFCSLVLYQILQNFKDNKPLHLFLSLSFLMMCIIYDGNHIMLEPLSILFQLLALQHYFKFRKTNHLPRLLFCGAMVSLSFLAKQYGLFLLLPIGLDILMRKNAILKSLAILTIGVLLPLVLLYLYYAWHDTTLVQFLKYILGQGQTFDKGTGTGIHTGFKLSHLLDCFLYIPFVFVIPFFIKQSNYKDVIFYIVLALSSLSVFILASYDHYFQYIFAYFIILFSYVASVSKRFLTSIPFYLILAFGVIKICAKTVSTLKHQKIDYELQQENFVQLKNTIPNGSKVYLSGISCAHYYLGDYHSLDLKKIGYAFPGYFYPKTIVNTMEANSYVIISQDYLMEYMEQTEGFEKKTFQFLDENRQAEIITIIKKP